MNQFKFVFVLLFVLAACQLEEPKISNFTNLKVLGLKGKKIKFSFDALVENPNGTDIKLIKAKLNLTISGIKLGEIKLAEKVVISSNKTENYGVPLTLEIAKVNYLRLIRLKLDDFDVQIQGFIKVRAKGKTLKIPLNEKRLIQSEKMNAVINALEKKFKGGLDKIKGKTIDVVTPNN